VVLGLRRGFAGRFSGMAVWGGIPLPEDYGFFRFEFLASGTIENLALGYSVKAVHVVWYNTTCVFICLLSSVCFLLSLKVRWNLR